MRFKYGNLYQRVKKPEFTNEGYPKEHKFTSFFKVVGEDAQNSGKYVEKIVYELHSTFKKPTATRDKAPFTYWAITWGSFDMKINIHWKKWLKKKPT